MPLMSPWIRLDIDWDDPKWLDDLPWSARACWVILKCHCKKLGINGLVSIPNVEKMARERKIEPSDLWMCIEAAIEEGELIEHPDVWEFKYWAEEQASESKHRVKRWREKQDKQQTQENCGVTLRNATDRYEPLQALPCITTTTTTTETDTSKRESAGATGGRDLATGKAYARPTQEECIAYGKEIGLDEQSSTRFFLTNEGTGWMTRKGPIINWKPIMLTWRQRDIDNPQKPTNGHHVQTFKVTGIKPIE